MTIPSRPRTFPGARCAALVLALATGLAVGCSGPAPITPELYEKALSVKTKRAGSKLLIVTRVEPASPGYWEYRQILVSTGGPPVLVTHGEGVLGDPQNSTASVDFVGKDKDKKPASDVKEVIVKYQVYTGGAKTGTPLFEGERRTPVDP